MRLPQRFFWLLLYVLGTFAWMVFFEHGPGWEKFQAGAKADLTRAWEKLEKWATGQMREVPLPGEPGRRGENK